FGGVLVLRGAVRVGDVRHVTLFRRCFTGNVTTDERVQRGGARPPQARARRTGGGIEGRGGARSRPAEGAVVSGSHEDSIIADRGGSSQAAPGRVGPPRTRGQTEPRERR